ncbi:hypothetical protein E4U54_005179 [Claviceps lovelessii]|nr:hypothetical protein E4U54_005179 [Claviceps lovelessii]
MVKGPEPDKVDSSATPAPDAPHMCIPSTSLVAPPPPRHWSESRPVPSSPPPPPPPSPPSPSLLHPNKQHGMTPPAIYAQIRLDGSI